jgi:tRNA nucleotidyltransferase (CCA-adding enzyme)
MADYIYLLQNRLTPAQFAALQAVREVAKSRNSTVFLVGGAVRDLTAGFSIRDLDFAIQGNALKLKKDFAKAGFVLTGEHEPTQALFFSYPGGVRLEIGSTLSATYPKPGKPVYKPASILDDLRRRDFTANAMAISLNEGSYGLLMDPLNGVADLENMELRLVSNYGFIEDPVRMIRAARLTARLGWHMEEKTRQRYDNGKSEGHISAAGAYHTGYEAEEIFHEEDPLRVLRRLETEGWGKHLFAAWTAAKANETELNKLRDTASQLGASGIHPDPSAAYFLLLTAKLSAKEISALKKTFPRPGFAEQIDAIEGQTRTFAADFSGKAAATPSEAWKMLYAAVPEQVLSLAYSSKSAPVQARFKAFFQDWPAARGRIPYQVMQEMRITPDLPVYNELLDKLFFAIMDAKLETPEAIKAFLEPYSPPAPPPPPSLRRRPVKRETKAPKAKKATVKVPVAESVPATDVQQPAVPPPPVKAAAKSPAKAVAPKAAALVNKTPAKPAPVPSAPAKKTAVPSKAAPMAKKNASTAKKPATSPKAPARAAKKVVPAKKPAVKKPVSKPAKKAAPSKKPTPAPKKKPVVPAKTAKKAAPTTKPFAKKSPAKATKKAPAKVAKKAAKKR